jgi:hypothetical protein
MFLLSAIKQINYVLASEPVPVKAEVDSSA